MGAIAGGSIVGTVLTPEPPRTHYYDRADQAAQRDNNQIRHEKLWIPDDSTGFYALWTALFTCVLAVSTILLWSETARSSEVAEKGLTAIERAFVFIDGFNVELTTAADVASDTSRMMPLRHQQDAGLEITRFAVQPRWKNGGSTPTDQLVVRVDWRIFREGIPPTSIFPTEMVPAPFFSALRPSNLLPILKYRPPQNSSDGPTDREEPNQLS
jgi:hypothetical protein